MRKPVKSIFATAMVGMTILIATATAASAGPRKDGGPNDFATGWFFSSNYGCWGFYTNDGATNVTKNGRVVAGYRRYENGPYGFYYCLPN